MAQFKLGLGAAEPAADVAAPLGLSVRLTVYVGVVNLDEQDS